MEKKYTLTKGVRRGGAPKGKVYVNKAEKQNKYPMTKGECLFEKEESTWYIVLPEYIKKGGLKAELAMVAGADELLDYLSGGEKRVTMDVSTNPFGGANFIERNGICEDALGGADYIFNGEHELWLCNVTKFVFGSFPSTIYFKVKELSHH